MKKFLAALHRLIVGPSLEVLIACDHCGEDLGPDPVTIHLSVPENEFGGPVQPKRFHRLRVHGRCYGSAMKGIDRAVKDYEVWCVNHGDVAMAATLARRHGQEKLGTDGENVKRVVNHRFDRYFEKDASDLPYSPAVLDAVGADLVAVLGQFDYSAFTPGFVEAVKVAVTEKLYPVREHVRFTRLYEPSGNDGIAWVGLEGDEDVIRALGVSHRGPEKLLFRPESAVTAR